ncbi:unnamed protein product [Hermetia illucens]|uniref:Uncharacterized protein n=1 Tax=Hermetia illucens TaxID=343691 RepID=A0A7R8UJ02_HERIL|nr:unnamed protein product [Hermetia illucens]
MKFILLALAFIGAASAVIVTPYANWGYSGWGHGIAPAVSAFHAPVVSSYSAPVYGHGYLGYAAPGWGYDIWKKKAA